MMPNTLTDYAVFGFAPLEFDEYTAPVVTSLTRVATDDGREYLSDRFTAIQADLIIAGDGVVDARAMRVNFRPAPDVQPPLSTQRLRAQFLHRLTDLHITVHEGGPHQMQHLYLDGRHIGFVMPFRNDPPGNMSPLGMTVDEIPAVREVARHIEGMSEGGALFDEWDLACAILHKAGDDR